MAPRARADLGALLTLMSAEKLQHALEAAFHSGTLMHKNNGILCSCAPGKKYPLGRGPRALRKRCMEPPRSIIIVRRLVPSVGMSRVNGSSVFTACSPGILPFHSALTRGLKSCWPMERRESAC